jgi:hypothetical protein
MLVFSPAAGLESVLSSFSKSVFSEMILLVAMVPGEMPAKRMPIECEIGVTPMYS